MPLKLGEFIASLKSSKALNLIILLLIVAAVPLTVFISQKQQDIRQRASGTISCETSSPEKIGEKPDPQKAKSVVEELDKANKELLDITNENILRTQSLSENGGLRESVFRRKNLFTETMRRNPDKALKEVLSDQNRNYLESKTQNCIEAKTGEEGELIVIIADFFKDKLSTTNYTLQTNQGKRIQIHPANLTQNLTSGMKVKIKEGYRLDNDFLFDASISDNLSVQRSEVNPSAAEPILPVEKLLVLMVNFRNAREETLTKARADEAINIINNYYSENSYGKTRAEGKSYGWYTLDIDQTCDFWVVGDEALKKAMPDIENPEQYINGSLLIIAPFNNCPWGGISFVGKTLIQHPVTGEQIKLGQLAVQSREAVYSDNIFPHEFGHTLGARHAGFFDCGTIALSYNQEECFRWEYDDYFDVMGHGRFGHMNAPHKEFMGYFNPSNIKTVTSSGIYMIEPIETNTYGLKALKIPRGSNNDYIYVEYRQPILADKDTAFYSDVFEGALLHVGGPTEKTLLIPAYVSPLYLFSDSMRIALKPGDSFNDPKTGTRVAILSKNSSYLTLNVSLSANILPPTQVKPINFIRLYPDNNSSVPSGDTFFSGNIVDNVSTLGTRYASLYINGEKKYSYTYSRNTYDNPTIMGFIKTKLQLVNGDYNWFIRVSDEKESIYVDSPILNLKVQGSGYGPTPTPIPTSIPTSTPTIPVRGIGFSNLYPNNSQVANPVKFSGTIVDSLSTIGYRYIYIYVDGSKVYNSYYYHYSSSSQNVPVSYTSTNNYGLGSHTWYVKTTDLFSNVLATSQKLNFTIGSSTPSPTQSFASPTPIPTGISIPTPTRVPTPTPTQPAIPTPTNSAISYPSLTITSPASYQYIKRGSSLTAKVSVSDSTGIKRVDYSFNGPILCTSSSSPYSCTFTVPTSLPPGYNTFKATAHNNLNLSTSKSLTVILY